MANDWTPAGFWTNEAPPSYKYTSFGTAAGTSILATAPAILHSIVIIGRAASGSIIMYDSAAGTSANVIGTLVIGTSTSNDPPPAYLFDAQTKYGLSIAWSANTAGVALSLP